MALHQTQAHTSSKLQLDFHRTQDALHPPSYNSASFSLLFFKSSKLQLSPTSFLKVFQAFIRGHNLFAVVGVSEVTDAIRLGEINYALRRKWLLPWLMCRRSCRLSAAWWSWHMLPIPPAAPGRWAARPLVPRPPGSPRPLPIWDAAPAWLRLALGPIVDLACLNYFAVVFGKWILREGVVAPR